jgi:hypothetical protein
MSIKIEAEHFWAWLKKLFTSIESNGAHIAVIVTEQIKADLESGAAGFLAAIADKLTNSNIPTEVVDAIKKELPNILKAELAVEGLPTSPTADDILKFENEIITAFGLVGNKSKLYTTIAAQAYGVINSMLAQPGKPTFSAWVRTVESIYEDYQADLAAIQ